MGMDSCSIDPTRTRKSQLGLARAQAPDGHEPHRLPELDRESEVVIDPWWGTIQPHQLHPEIATIGELELIAHLESGGRAIDTRKDEYVTGSGTIPGCKSIPWEEITEHKNDLDPDGVTVLFCNGPQCAATPRAVEKLLADGVEAKRLAYYRGGIQDWQALGLPLTDAE